MKNNKEINLKLAKQAALHAQRIIKKGATQISNNVLPSEKYDALYDGVEDGRTLARQEINAGFSESLIGDKKLNYYEKLVNLSAKYSLGNCYEMSLHAFDYLSYSAEAADTNFEIFDILGGDHIFVVIGRDRETKSHHPKTWNKDAVICDPWNEKNNVYMASEYSKKLKSWRREIKKDDSGKIISVKNTLDDFDEKQYMLMTGDSGNFTAQQIRDLKQGRVEIVKNNFLNEANSLRGMLAKLQFKIIKRNFHHPHIILSNYLDKIHLAEKKLISIEKAVSTGNISTEFRTLYNQLTSELETAYYLLFPPTEVYTILADSDTIESYPRQGLFYSKPAENKLDSTTKQSSIEKNTLTY